MPATNTAHPTPYPFLTLRRTLPATGKSDRGTIIHIQDVHRNAEAQNNISQAVRVLIQKRDVAVVALEGAARPISLAPFQRMSDPAALKKVADFLMRDKQLSGPLHAMLVSLPYATSVVGIDDAVHYRNNVQAYRDAQHVLPTAQNQLRNARQQWDENAARTLAAPLTSFHKRQQAFREGRLAMGDYLQSLWTREKNVEFPTIRAFLIARQLELALDFKAIATERDRLLQKLATTLRASERQELMDAALAFQSGAASPLVFYDRLQSLCARTGVDLGTYPCTRNYMHYLHASYRIEADALFDETTRLERRVVDALAQTPDEIALMEQSESLYLTQKLLDFGLTRAEWNDYKQRRDVASMSGIRLRAFERFYEEAEQRDARMAANTLRIAIPGKTTLLVTGGFHSTGIDRVLTEAGYNVIQATPKLTKIEDAGSTYLTAFLQDKTPLDQLFAGEKLFLSPPQTQPLPMAALATASLSDNPTQEFQRAFPNTTLSARKQQNINGGKRITWERASTGVARTLALFFTPKEVTRIESAAAPGSWMHSTLYNLMIFLGHPPTLWLKFMGLAWVPLEGAALLWGLNVVPSSPVAKFAFLLLWASADFFTAYYGHKWQGVPLPIRPLQFLKGATLIWAYASAYLLLGDTINFLDSVYFWQAVGIHMLLDLATFSWEELVDWGWIHPGLKYDPELSEFFIGGFLHDRPSIRINPISNQTKHIPDADMVLDRIITDYVPQVAKSLRLNGQELQSELRTRFEVRGVETPTQLLIPQMFPSRYRWGRIRISRGSTPPIFYVPLNLFRDLRSETDLRHMAFSLVFGVRWRQHYDRITSEVPSHSVKKVHDEMTRFERDWNEIEKNFLTPGFRLRHVWRYLRDKATMLRLDHQLHIQFQQIKRNNAQDERVIRTHMQNFRAPDSVIIDREEIGRHFRDLRVPITRIQKEYEGLIDAAVSMGEYDLALPILRWTEYLYVVDSGMIPLERTLLMCKVLARNGRYDELIKLLRNVHAREIEYPVFYSSLFTVSNVLKMAGRVLTGQLGSSYARFSDRFRRKVIEIDRSEVGNFLYMVDAMGFRENLVRTLTRQAEIVNNDRNRDIITEALRTCLALLDRTEDRYEAEVKGEPPPVETLTMQAELAMLPPLKSLSFNLTGRMVAALFLPLLITVTVVLAIPIKLTSRGPLFFTQERIGYNGKKILIWKLRTVTTDPDPSKRKTTFIGKLIRPLGLDELPQILSLLKGDMQWFGPRPHMTHEISDEYIRIVLSRSRPGCFSTPVIAHRLGSVLHRLQESDFQNELRDLERSSWHYNAWLLCMCAYAAFRGLVHTFILKTPQESKPAHSKKVTGLILFTIPYLMDADAAPRAISIVLLIVGLGGLYVLQLYYGDRKIRSGPGAHISVETMKEMHLNSVIEIDNATSRSPWSKKLLQDRLLQPQSEQNDTHWNFGVVALRGKTVVGFMVYEMDGTGLRIIKLGVDPKFQRQDIGRKLVYTLIDRLQPPHKTHINVMVREHNDDAQLFFRKLGFKTSRSDINHHFYTDTDEDGYDMIYKHENYSMLRWLWQLTPPQRNELLNELQTNLGTYLRHASPFRRVPTHGIRNLITAWPTYAMNQRIIKVLISSSFPYLVAHSNYDFPPLIDTWLQIEARIIQSTYRRKTPHTRANSRTNERILILYAIIAYLNFIAHLDIEKDYNENLKDALYDYINWVVGQMETIGPKNSVEFQKGLMAGVERFVRPPATPKQAELGLSELNNRMLFIPSVQPGKSPPTPSMPENPINKHYQLGNVVGRQA